MAPGKMTVNDDNTSAELDLRHEVPTDHASVDIETIEAGGKMLGGSGYVRARGTAGPTTMQLAVASGLIMGTACLIGVPAIPALIAGLCAPVVTYTLVRLISRWTR